MGAIPEHPRPVRDARSRRGVGVRELARLAGVSPGAVTQWEASEARGSIRRATVERALRALGSSLAEEYPHPEPLARREDRVALELHRAVAVKLIDRPEDVLAVVPDNLRRIRDRVRGAAARSWADEWERLTTSDRLGPLIDAMLGCDRRSVNLRQVSPFAGVLTNDERVRAIGRASQ